MSTSIASGVFTVLDGPVGRYGARGDATSIYVEDPDCNTVELRWYPADAAVAWTGTGDPRRAVRRRARAVGFWRGALLCQGYLLALATRLRAYWRLPVLAARLVGDAVRGELRRNSLPRLILRVPVMLPIALRRMSSRTDSRERITACPCDLARPDPYDRRPD